MPSILRNSVWFVLILLLGCSGKKETRTSEKSEDRKSDPKVKTGDKKTTDRKPVKVTDQDVKQPVDDSPGEFRVEALNFRKEFRDDVKAATKKYHGMIIEVQSAVEEVGATATGDGYFLLAGVTEPLPLNFQCLTVDKQPWASAIPGQTVKLRGRCEVLGEELKLRDCKILEVTGPGPLLIAAVKLVQDYDKDAAATAKMYDDRYLLLTGEVDRTEEIAALNTARILIKVAGKITVSCVLDSMMADQAKRLKPGQPIKLVGQQRPFNAAEGVELSRCLLFAKP
jgi:tRNA_anti-like